MIVWSDLPAASFTSSTNGRIGVPSPSIVPNGGTETVEFVFAKIVLTYTVYRSDGTVGSVVTGGWDLARDTVI